MLNFITTFLGKSMEELIGTWQREAQAALTVREQGMELELYKVVGERRVSRFSLSKHLVKRR